MQGSLGTIWGHFGCTLGTLWCVGAQEQVLWSQSPPGQAEPWQQNCAHIMCRRLLCAPASSKPPPCLETYVSKAEKCLHICIYIINERKKRLGLYLMSPEERMGLLRSNSELRRMGDSWGGRHSTSYAKGPQGCGALPPGKGSIQECRAPSNYFARQLLPVLALRELGERSAAPGRAAAHVSSRRGNKSTACLITQQISERGYLG